MLHSICCIAWWCVRAACVLRACWPREAELARCPRASHAPRTRQNAVKKSAKDAEAAKKKAEKEAQASRCLAPGLGLGLGVQASAARTPSATPRLPVPWVNDSRRGLAIDR